MGKYFGTYQRNLDNKYRLQIPNKLVSALPDCFYLLRGFEGALSIYDKETFDKFLSSLEKMSYMDSKMRTYMRLALSSVETLEVDSHGRITLGSATASKYKISNEVTIIGVLDHFEVWDRKAYDEFEAKNAASYENIADDIALLDSKEVL